MVLSVTTTLLRHGINCGLLLSVHVANLNPLFTYIHSCLFIRIINAKDKTV